MKIYEIGTGYTPIPAQMGAATEIVVEELTKAFLKLHTDVKIVDIAAQERAANQLPIREVSVPRCFSGTDVQLGIMHKLKRVVYSIALAGELKKILKEETEPVVLHFHNQYNLFFFLKLVPSSLRKKARIAYTNHSGIWRMEWEKIEKTIQKRYFQEAVCMKQADVLFVLNEETRRNAIDHLGVPEDRIHVIANGVNTDIYYPLSAEEKLSAKEKWGLSDRKVILQVGSVCENKGQLRSLRYLLPLMKEDPAVTFAYAGGIVEEEYQKKIAAYAQEHKIANQVMYLGMIEPGNKLNDLYNTSVLTIFPSEYEAFGLVVIESFAAGVPVLVNQAGRIRLGAGIILFDSNREAQAVQEYLSGLKCTLPSEARENAVQNFSWKKIAQDYSVHF